MRAPMNKMAPNSGGGIEGTQTERGLSCLESWDRPEWKELVASCTTIGTHKGSGKGENILERGVYLRWGGGLNIGFTYTILQKHARF